MEEPIFFDNGGEQVFGILHSPDATSPYRGVVLCHAFGEEKLWSHRVFVNFARQAAGHGIAALRFDFRGHGDSSGSSEENTMPRFFSDIDAAISLLGEKCPTIERFGLVGLRFGATLAALYGDAHEGIDRIILWEPIVSGKKYMQELLRINLTTQLAVYGKVTNNREALIQEMKGGRPANVDGYLLNFDFFTSASEIDLHSLVSAGKDKQVLVTQIAPTASQNDREELLDLAAKTDFEFLKIVEPPFWREIKPYTSTAANLIGASIAWLGQDDV